MPSAVRLIGRCSPRSEEPRVRVQIKTAVAGFLESGCLLLGKCRRKQHLLDFPAGELTPLHGRHESRYLILEGGQRAVVVCARASLAGAETHTFLLTVQCHDVNLDKSVA